MALFNARKLSIVGQGLQYKFLLVKNLIFILPLLFTSYIFYINNISLKPSQMLVFAFILIIILAGLIILRQIFDRLLTVSAFMKNALNNNEYLADIQKDTAELHEITVTFNSLMKKYESTNNELRQRVLELFAIKELTEIASKILDINELLDLLLEKVMAVSAAKMGSVFKVESEKDRFVLVASKGLETELEKGFYININESLARIVFSDRKPLLVQDIEADPRISKTNDPKYGSPSFLIMPIFIRENLLAILNLSNKETGQAFDSNDQEILSIMIGEIAFALENAKLHSRTEEYLRDLQKRAAELTEANNQLQEEISRRKKSEATLQKNEELFRDLFENANDLIQSVDPDGRFLQVNKKWHELLGYSEKDLSNLSMWDIIHQDSISYCKKMFQKVFSGETVNNIDAIFVCKNGKSIPVEGTVTCQFEGIKPQFTRCIFRDITERKLSEERLLKETERTTLLLELYLQAPKLSDKELYNYVLEKAVDLTGSEIGFFHLVTEDQKDIILTTWNSEALKNCSTAYDTHYSIDKAGNWVDCVRQAKPIIYNDFSNSPNQKGLPEGHTRIKRFMSVPVIVDNKIRYIFGVGNKPGDYDERDTVEIQLIANELSKIMRHRNAERALKESEERYRALFEYNPIDTIIVDNKAKILMYNFAKNSSGSRLPKIGDVMYKDYAGKHQIDMFEELMECEKSGKPKEFPDLAYKNQFLLVRISPFSGGAIITSINITERKKLQAQLQQAQKMDSIGTLAGGIAHDFNNLLTAIVGNAELGMLGLDKNNPSRESIEEIKKAAERAASLTRQLLAFSRKQVIMPEVLDLNEIVRGLEKMLIRMIEENIELKMIMEPSLYHIEIDPGQIEQIIVNLVVNARDAMPEGGTLVIETSNVLLDDNYFLDHGVMSLAGPYVLLSVSDNGVGMKQETLSRIFEPFFTTKDRGKGTGLGLSTVYGIVKQNNGFVWAYSEPGQETTFKVYLPKTDKNNLSVEIEKGSIKSLFGSETVLLVEDDESLRKIALKTLRQHGYEILDAKEGKEALEISNEYEGAIQLLLTDVVMPGMSGRELAEQLQTLRSELKVIYMSGYSDKTITLSGVLIPGVNFIEKPFSPERLARKVREVLDG